MADPIDDFSNYQMPVFTATDKFSATATANDATVAENLALAAAQQKATSQFGSDTTQFGLQDVRIKLNDDGSYTATYNTVAYQVEPQAPVEPTVENSAPAEVTDDPTIQRFDDGSSIQTLDDGSTIITDSEGNTSATEAPQDQPQPDENEYAAETNRLKAQEAAAAEAASNESTAETARLNRQNAMVEDARKQGVLEQSANMKQTTDWRVKLSLAPKANYLYKVAKQGDLLFPLSGTEGVIFPYTPQIQVSYQANYDPTDLTHTNYKYYNYRNSEVSQISITADFTAQDTAEANYLLAVIHFFKSVTKMFYGQDSNPANGTPPPLCYLTGLGAYQFDNHPLVVTSFQYSLPNDVDYIRAGSTTQTPGVNLSAYQSKVNTYVPSLLRLLSSNLQPGAASKKPEFSKSLASSDATYVPTKIQLQITCLPIVTRADVSNTFSVEKYATGSLTRGSRRQGGGIW